MVKTTPSGGTSDTDSKVSSRDFRGVFLGLGGDVVLGRLGFALLGLAFVGLGCSLEPETLVLGLEALVVGFGLGLEALLGLGFGLGLEALLGLGFVFGVGKKLCRGLGSASGSMPCRGLALARKVCCS